MATLNYSELQDGESYSFDPFNDVLSIDIAIPAAQLIIFGSADVTLSAGGKTVTLLTPISSLSSSHILFTDGTFLMIGDNSPDSSEDGLSGTLVGNAGDDFIMGLDGDDLLEGLGGNDRVDGGGGDDTLEGGDGDDLLYGGDGNDTARYADSASGVTVSLAVEGPQDTQGAGADTLANIENLVGSPYADTLAGDAGANNIDAGNGDDHFIGI